jgi:hypothetical protein
LLSHFTIETNITKMKLSKLVLSAIRGNSDLRYKVRTAIGVSNPTMTRLLRENDDDLTKAAVLAVIREELGVSEDQMFEKESEVKEPQS